MSGFSESQIPIDFDPVPAEKQETPNSPEERSRMLNAFAAIKRLYPHENMDEFELRSSENKGHGLEMIFRKSADVDRHKEEVFLQVTFNEEGDVVDIRHIYPSRPAAKKVSNRR